MSAENAAALAAAPAAVISARALDFETWNGPEVPRVVGYRAAHMRVEAARGRASAYPCSDCGRPAADWAYVHDDPDELVTTLNGKPRHYSLDSDRYQPMCRPCHRRFDAGQRTLRAIARW